MKRIVYFIFSNGIWNSLLIAFNHFEGLFFDARYGTDTCKRVSLSNLNIASASKNFGTKYDPSPISALRRLLRWISIPDSVNFVDFGSGKGRVLLVASEFPFSRIVGLEFSSDLCSISKSNISKFKSHKMIKTPISVLNIDAIQYKIQDDDAVFFFFNPFGAEVMRPVIENILQSYNKKNRRILFIYYNPVHANLFNEFKLIELSHSIHSFGRLFNIYTIKP